VTIKLRPTSYNDHSLNAKTKCDTEKLSTRLNRHILGATIDRDPNFRQGVGIAYRFMSVTAGAKLRSKWVSACCSFDETITERVIMHSSL